MTLSTAVDRDQTSRAGARSYHRDDLQGMRAVAVVAVIAAHAGVSVLGGGFVGVDLFYVLSGFLITELLIRESQKRGRLSLRGFWARRVRRLLPASTLVLVVTAVASAVILPITQRLAVATDVVWAALFAANWHSAAEATDYFDQDRAVSPIQHYWSLAVEEQFYLVWPLLILLIALLAARGRVSLRLVVGLVAALVVVVSFTYEVWLTGRNQPYAYFGTTARAWQLALGALLAAGVPLLSRLPAWARTVSGLAGVAGFGWAVVALSETGGSVAYPGTAALAPTLAAGLLIAAGVSADGHVVGRLLALRPLVWLGDLSYSLYLWHFPILILGAVVFAPAGWVVRSGLVVVVLLASIVTHKLVENPVRTAKPLVGRPLLTLAIGVALVGVSLGSALVLHPTQGQIEEATEIIGPDGRQVDLGPVLLNPRLDVLSVPGCNGMDYEDTDFGACDQFGDPNGDRLVTLIGDSHGGTIEPGVEAAAKEAGWRMSFWAKAGCIYPDVTMFDKAHQSPHTACDEFRTAVTDHAVAQDPDLVILTSNYHAALRVVDRSTGDVLSGEESRKAIVAGWRSSIERFTQAGIPVVVAADWPHAPEVPADCLVRTGDARECVFERTGRPPEFAAVRGLADVRVVDVGRDFCPQETCTPVLGDLLVFLDQNHFTAAYARTLAPFFLEALRQTR